MFFIIRSPDIQQLHCHGLGSAIRKNSACFLERVTTLYLDRGVWYIQAIAQEAFFYLFTSHHQQHQQHSRGEPFFSFILM